jgi:hypothetical protein
MNTTKVNGKMITETEFQKLPKEIQKARWDYFLATDGYYDEEIVKNRNVKKIKRMITALEKMKALGDWGPNPELWLNKLKEIAE